MRRDLGQMLQIMKIIQQHQETDYLSACERANCDENGADADFFFFFMALDLALILVRENLDRRTLYYIHNTQIE